MSTDINSDPIQNGSTSSDKRKKQQISINDYFTKRRKMSTNDNNEDKEKEKEEQRDLLASAAEKRLNKSKPTELLESEAEKQLTQVKPALQESEAEKRFSYLSSQTKHALQESEAEKRFSYLSSQTKPALQESEAEKRFSHLSRDNSNESINSTEFKEEEEIVEPKVSIPSHFYRTSTCSVALPSLQPSDDHSILFRPHIIANKPPRPYPEVYRDHWNKSHVRMPCSPDNMYPTLDKKIQKRWELIEGTLLQPFQTSKDLEEAILVYNHHYKGKWNFESWHSYCNIHLNDAEREDLFTNLIPNMVNLALQLPHIVTQSPKLLQHGVARSLTLSQHQASCLLANAFFCTYPRRNSLKNSEYSSYPDINFSRLFRGIKDVVNQVKTEKLKTILNYFQRILKETPCGTITFTRKVLNESSIPSWEHSTKEMCDLYVTAQGTIEDEGNDFLQVDFANRMIGGGVVGEGCVQEEIRFLICPELILARLFTEKLEPNESLLITGIERFSSYSGYAQTFKFKGNYNDYTPSDRWGRRYTQVIAIDAHVFHCYSDQFQSVSLQREVEKALCGFLEEKTLNKTGFSGIATGNWGCGAFGGDIHLKALLQLIASAIAERDLIYFTFGDKTFKNDLDEMHSFIKLYNITVGQLWNMLLRYGKELKAKKSHIHLYPYLKQIFEDYTCDTDDGGSSCNDDNPLEIRGVPCEIPGDMDQPSPDYIGDTP